MSPDYLQTILGIGAMAALIALNAFFVAAEFSFVKVRGSQLKVMKKGGKPNLRLRLALGISERLDRYLSATQLGVTLTSLGLGSVGEPFVASCLRDPLARIGILGPNTVTTLSYALGFFCITFFHIVLGELCPKTVAIRRPKEIALWLGFPLVIFYYVFYPFIRLLNVSTNGINRLLGFTTVHEFDHAVNQEELQFMLANARHPHPIDELVNKLMLKALRLKETTAEQIMIPRDRVTVLWKEKSLPQNLSIAQKSGYSRLPFCGETMDEVLGVIHVKELLWQHQVLGEQTELTTIVRPVLTFMDKTRLPAMLELFRKSRNHLAVVIDREERMLGLVSFEDVLEELVGDIRDEFDIEKGPFFERTDTMVLIDADLPLRDLALEMNWPLATDTTDTVERWAIRHFGNVPKPGQSVQVHEFKVTATEASGWRIRRLRIEREMSLAEERDV